MAKCRNISEMSEGIRIIKVRVDKIDTILTTNFPEYSVQYIFNVLREIMLAREKD